MNQRSAKPLFLTGGLILAASIAFAQAPAPQPSQTPPSSPTATSATPTSDATMPSDRSELTLRGCVQRADSSTSSPSSTAGAPAVPVAEFILIDVVDASSAATPSTTPSSTSATSASSSSSYTKSSTGTRYSLSPSDSSVQLGSHVGHQIEVKGRRSPSSSVSADSAAASVGSTPAFIVTSVKMIAATCGSGSDKR